MFRFLRVEMRVCVTAALQCLVKPTLAYACSKNLYTSPCIISLNSIIVVLAHISIPPMASHLPETNNVLSRVNKGGALYGK